MAKLVNSQLPVVYACSGCSSIAQLANRIAVELDRDGVAEMSCIAGIGGKVKPLLEKAKRASNILVIDGCVLQCSLHCFEGAGIAVNNHIILTDHGIKKVLHADFSNEGFSAAYVEVRKVLITTCLNS